MSQTDTRYTGTAIALHWTIAVLIFATFVVGLAMVDLPQSPLRLRIYDYHKWAGIAVLALVLVRIIWRSTHQPPELPESQGRLEKILAHAVHHSLYLLMILAPLSGWLFSSARGFQTIWFGVLPLPDLVPKNAQLAKVLLGAHEVLTTLIILLALGHTAAALRQHFIARDGTLARMWPRFK